MDLSANTMIILNWERGNISLVTAVSQGWLDHMNIEKSGFEFYVGSLPPIFSVSILFPSRSWVPHFDNWHTYLLLGVLYIFFMPD